MLFAQSPLQTIRAHMSVHTCLLLIKPFKAMDSSQGKVPKQDHDKKHLATSFHTLAANFKQSLGLHVLNLWHRLDRESVCQVTRFALAQYTYLQSSR